MDIVTGRMSLAGRRGWVSQRGFPRRFCVSSVLGTPLEATKLSNLRLTFETRLLGARIFPRSAADAVDVELRSRSDLFQIRGIPES